MENETLACPYCGALYRDAIPQGTVQVKCEYCGGNIMVPTFFGGVIQRCTNHPNILAAGLCNDCGRSYCDNCLSLESVENGTLFLCPACRARREGEKTRGFLLLGMFMFALGILALLLAPEPVEGTFGLILFAFFGSPFLIWGIYRTLSPASARTLRVIREEEKQQQELMNCPPGEASPSVVYDRLLNRYLRVYDPKVAYDALERRIQLYRLSGMSRGEAVKKIAEEEG